MPQWFGVDERNRSTASGATRIDSGESNGSSRNDANSSSVVRSFTTGVNSAAGMRHGLPMTSAYVDV